MRGQGCSGDGEGDVEWTVIPLRFNASPARPLLYIHASSLPHRPRPGISPRPFASHLRLCPRNSVCSSPLACGPGRTSICASLTLSRSAQLPSARHHHRRTTHDHPVLPCSMASVAQLPNETLHAIFENLTPAGLAVVLRASQRFRLVAEHILYTSITIIETLPRASPVPRHSATLAHTLLARPHLADVVRRLAIRWQTDPGPRDDYVAAAGPVLADLHRALLKLVHLEQLDLALGLAGGTLDARAVLGGCVFPSLRIFALSGVGRGSMSPKLYATAAGLSPPVPIAWFLAVTPTIEQLRLPDCYETLDLLSDALPLLATFRGSALAAASVLPGRPVQQLGLVGHEFITERDLQRIALASVPIRYLDLSMMSVTPILLRDISRHLCAVEVLKVKLALRHTLHHALSGIVSRPLALPPPLSGGLTQTVST
ncbi:hypothetical protein BC628DRAFT_1351479 [Trametes gibbosa]|nr:hypothetical protein BC628DRAFT_1351479 [Trametes gibbosa]